MMTVNKEAKKLTSPTRKLNKSKLGINEIMTQATKKKETVIEEEDTGKRPKDPFTIDELRMSWRKYAFKAKEDELGTLYTAMIGRDPEIGENFSIKHTVDNDVQLGFIKTHERSEEHTSELQSRPHLVCRLLLEKKKKENKKT